MTRTLPLHDIQGNVVRAYGRYHYPFARYFFLHIEDAAAGRRFVNLVRDRVTSGATWTGDKPAVTFNIGFTFLGLYALSLPTRTLQGMPEEFIDGMKSRAHILGDRDPTKRASETTDWDAKWDPVWRDNRDGDGKNNVHIWISMNALAKPFTDQPDDALDAQTRWLVEQCDMLDQKVRILSTNGPGGTDLYQSANAVFETLPDGRKIPTRKEHFGFTDGIGDPAFEGQYPPEQMTSKVIGRGKLMSAEEGWQPIATGEFVLGHPDESQELTPSSTPANFMANGSFMVYRKLHENLGSFTAVIEEEAERFARVMDVPLDEARETLMAKIVGRWSDGVPLSTHPTFAEWQEFRATLADDDPLVAAEKRNAYLTSPAARDFRYADDMRGFKCPGGAHLRRVNTRDYLDPLNDLDSQNPDATTQLNKRRRILRRGLPYGPTELGVGDDTTEQGVIFMVICASIFRQFEFVQQQWIQYGLDFNLGNNTCPLLGDHTHHTRHSIPSDPKSGRPPYVIDKLKTFVETRGGDYFFIPSLTALRMIGMGVVDPT
ncbi:MAG: peroxidase [Pseudomonadota bacterium]